MNPGPHTAEATAMQPYVLERTVTLAGPIGEVFPFFADAANLERITPPMLRFTILSPMPIALAEGTRIDYRLRIRGVPIRWRTRITRWDPPHAFEDEQERGPYTLWRHTHTFEQTTTLQGHPATRMRDTVRYMPRGGRALGALANTLFVRRDLRAIFDHRQRVLAKVFGLIETPGEEQEPAGNKRSQAIGPE